MGLPEYMKFKINRVKVQEEPDSCGYLASAFIRARMDGHSFEKATGFANESEAEKLRIQSGFGEFGYI